MARGSNPTNPRVNTFVIPWPMYNDIRNGGIHPHRSAVTLGENSNADNLSPLLLYPGKIL